MNRTRLLSAGALAAIAATVVCATPATAKSTITMSGSTSVAPLARLLAQGYVKAFPNTVTFRLLQGGSDIGINDVARGRVTIGNASRDPLPSDPKGIQFNRIARDGVCVVTNPNNAVPNLTQEQIQQIFTGRVRNWSDVPGAKVSGPIELVTRSAASGTQDAFQNIYLGPDLRVAGSASQKASNGLVQQTVRSSRTAIGYVDFKFIGGTNAVSYKGVPCTLRNAKSGTYPGIRNLWMVTRGKPAGATGKFIRWIRTSGAARKIVSSQWVAAN
ncbi:MAG: phosphate ABC transporter substrate-binding protein [Solirubrobacteraceae bacterium]